MKKTPCIVIAGSASGVGKTSIALGLVRAFSRWGMRVQPFKVGPDFLDPSHLTAASGRQCYSLDAWMMGESYVQALFARKAAGAEIAVVEGVMGMYDGSNPTNSRGSTVHIARLLGAPVLLVCNAHGVARSIAATVKGFTVLEPDSNMAGVIANNCGSERHKDMLKEALESADLPPLIGAVPRGEFPELPGRHLGLVSAEVEKPSESIFNALAEACERHVDMDAVLKTTRSVSEPKIGACGGIIHEEKKNEKEIEAAGGDRNVRGGKRKKEVRIGIARDEAFHFYYEDNLEALKDRGCELIEFSPLRDHRLPEVDAIYFGGGYPEEYAEKLSTNRRMRVDVRRFCCSGRPVYAECGGLMYLARSLQDCSGTQFSMAGVLPFRTQMLNRLCRLGYVEIKLTETCLWGEAGTVLRGHEFHYSKITREPQDTEGWRRPFSKSFLRPNPPAPAGWSKGNVLASYVHLYFAPNSEAVDHFITWCCKL